MTRLVKQGNDGVGARGHAESSCQEPMQAVLSQSPVPLDNSAAAQSMKVNDADQVVLAQFAKVKPEVSNSGVGGGRASDAALSLATDRTNSSKGDGSDEDEDAADINLTENSVRGPDKPGM